jgi:hypothetical protein
MPCDTIQTSELELKNPNIKLLMDALSQLGLNPQHDTQSGRISFRGGYWHNGTLTTASYGVEAQDIKVAYSRQIVGYAAKQFGWKLQEAATTRNGVAMTLKAKK